MAAITNPALVPTEEYIARFVEGGEKPVREYVDGILLPKPLGTKRQSQVAKCEEYHRWGVPYCWVIDPERKIAWEYFPDDPEPRRVEEMLTAGAIEAGLADVFRRV